MRSPRASATCGCSADGGLGVAEALRQISFRFAADDDQFMTIAKLRARAPAVGAGGRGGRAPPTRAPRRVHAVTSMPMMAQRDPWVNMLRTTVAAFGAGVGGADTVHGAAVRRGDPRRIARRTAASFARRMARNTQLLLLEESHLGRVLDPAGGSWFVEDLTEQLAEQGVGALPGDRGRAAVSPAARDFVPTQIAEVREQRTDDIAHRRTAVTGVNEYPEPRAKRRCRNRDPVGRASRATRRHSRRCATAPTPTSPSTGSRPTALLLPLGPLAEHNIRTTFAANLLASGGIEAVNPGPSTPPGSPTRFGRSRRRGRGDLRHRRAIRHRGGGASRPHAQPESSHVLLAGPEKAVADARPHQPDDYLTAKIDAVAALSGLLTRLGA